MQHLNQSQPPSVAVPRPDASSVLLAIYQAAQEADQPEFKRWVIGQIRTLVPFSSASWINGVMQDGNPIFNEVLTIDQKPDFREQFEIFFPQDNDPHGARMFAAPGQSFSVGYKDFPPPVVEGFMKPYDICWAMSGMVVDRTTGIFSVMCWYRSPDMPAFTEAERQLHQHLLPHFIQCLNAQRVQQVLRHLNLMAREGHVAALFEPTGRIHYAQAGFGELLRQEYADWPGSPLPATLLQSLSNTSNTYLGRHLVAHRQPTATGLWLLHLRPRAANDLLSPREREIATLLARGHTIKQAARTLGLSPATVDNILTEVYRKLSVNNRATLTTTLRS